jgi:hypothetical protein
VKRWIKKNFVLLKHCFLAKKSTVDAKAWLDKHYFRAGLTIGHKGQVPGARGPKKKKKKKKLTTIQTKLLKL